MAQMSLSPWELLLRAQELMIKTLFNSILQSFTTRITEVEKSVQFIKTSLQFAQKDVDNLKPLEEKLDTSNKEIDQLKSTLSYNHFHWSIWKTKAVQKNMRVKGWSIRSWTKRLRNWLCRRYLSLTTKCYRILDKLLSSIVETSQILVPV